MLMNKNNLHSSLAFLSLALLFFVVIFHIQFVILPISFLLLGLLSYLWSGRKALVLFLFLLPLINSTPDIFFNGYPFNYMGIVLFYLSGMMIASRLKKEKIKFIFPGYGIYLLFLAIISVSVLFVFLRWSNLFISPLAFLHDTPVVPGGDRLSFACIFPVITMALFSLTPYLAALIRQWDLKENEIFTPLQAGFCLSLLLALVQKWLYPDFLAQSWWGLHNRQVNGGFSDFNAFGFFAGVMFLYQAQRLTEKFTRRNNDIAVADRSESSAGLPQASGFKTLWFEILFLMIALAAIFVSGCRTAFFFVLLAVGFLIFSKKTSLRTKVLVVLLLALSLLVGGGTLKRRLQQTAIQTTRIATAADLFRAADTISNGRLTMLKDGAQMIARFPGSGIGAGNFLFYLKYFHFGGTAYFDLSLNQYLLIACETGLTGGLLFLFFLAVLLKKQRPGVIRSVLAAIAFAIFFNNFFWFPECLLLFWLFVAQTEPIITPVRKKHVVAVVAAILLFSLLNIVAFKALHPKTWAQKTSTSYDYGLYYKESEQGRQFNWTMAKAGLYIYLDNLGLSKKYTLLCGAPLSRLQNKRQVVDVYWQGRFLKNVVFRANSQYLLQIEDHEHSEGFLELRVRPAFNLKRLGLGAETRDLGIQLSGGDQ